MCVIPVCVVDVAVVAVVTVAVGGFVGSAASNVTNEITTASGLATCKLICSGTPVPDTQYPDNCGVAAGGSVQTARFLVSFPGTSPIETLPVDADG